MRKIFKNVINKNINKGKFLMKNNDENSTESKL